jgi:hypothetical protein
MAKYHRFYDDCDHFDGFCINRDKKQIIITEPITPSELYSQICDIFDDPDWMVEEFPMYAITSMTGLIVKPTWEILNEEDVNGKVHHQ